MTDEKEIRKAINKLIGATLFMTFEESDAVNIIIDYVEEQLRKDDDLK